MQENTAEYPEDDPDNPGEIITLPKTSYNYNYEYNSHRPHAVTRAGDKTFFYDLNGNMTQMVDGSNTRDIVWDEENRILSTDDTNGLTNYLYDAKGSRLVKDGKFGAVLYVNNNYTVRNDDLESKHVFAGNTRVASKLVMKEGESLSEKGIYFYHGDHLGSSSVITEKSGVYHESLEYFPYGETWVQERVSEDADRMPFKFTGKEQDPETGLYYFGARYYDPVLSRWVSVDPAYVLFLPNKNSVNNLPASGGVYRQSNLDSYGYCWNNPIIYYDPNGLWTFQIGVSGSGAVGGGGSIGGGIVFGYSEEQGVDIGLYGDIGFGGYSGVLLNATLDFAWSGNKNVHDVSDTSLAVGGSVDVGVSAGIQINKPFSNTEQVNTSNIYTFSVGIGGATGPYILPAEIHALPTYTGVLTIKDLFKGNSNNIKNPKMPTNNNNGSQNNNTRSNKFNDPVQSNQPKGKNPGGKKAQKPSQPRRQPGISSFFGIRRR